MNPCLVAPSPGGTLLSPVFFPVRTTHRRQGGALWARRYAKDTVDSTFMSRLTGQPIKRKLACVARAFFFSSGVFSR